MGGLKERISMTMAIYLNCNLLYNIGNSEVSGSSSSHHRRSKEKKKKKEKKKHKHKEKEKEKRKSKKQDKERKRKGSSSSSMSGTKQANPSLQKAEDAGISEVSAQDLSSGSSSADSPSNSPKRARKE